jgi:hypothetical protein
VPNTSIDKNNFPRKEKIRKLPKGFSHKLIMSIISGTHPKETRKVFHA